MARRRYVHHFGEPISVTAKTLWPLQYTDAPPPYSEDPPRSVHVKSLTGEQLMTVGDLPSNATGTQLKEAIQQRLGFLVAQQRLIFAGRIVNDEKTLHDQRVPNEATMHLVFAQRGC